MRPSEQQSGFGDERARARRDPCGRCRRRAVRHAAHRDRAQLPLEHVDATSELRDPLQDGRLAVAVLAEDLDLQGLIGAWGVRRKALTGLQLSVKIERSA